MIISSALTPEVWNSDRGTWMQSEEIRIRSAILSLQGCGLERAQLLGALLARALGLPQRFSHAQIWVRTRFVCRCATMTEICGSRRKKAASSVFRKSQMDRQIRKLGSIGSQPVRGFLTIQSGTSLRTANTISGSRHKMV